MVSAGIADIRELANDKLGARVGTNDSELFRAIGIRESELKVVMILGEVALM